MLHAPIQFPYPGSVTLFQGLRWKVRQLFDGGATALIVRDDAGVQGARREAVTNLVDASLVDEGGVRAVKHIDRQTMRLALYVARHLRERNDVILRDLGHHLFTAAEQGSAPRHRDNAHLAEIMRLLGWQKDGYAGQPGTFERSPVYRRVSKAR